MLYEEVMKCFMRKPRCTVCQVQVLSMLERIHSGLLSNSRIFLLIPPTVPQMASRMTTVHPFAFFNK